jgi:hypothetical protein
LFAGCYTTTTTTLSKDGPLSMGEATFVLKDGRRIVSSDYSRVENGYKVVGKVIFNYVRSDFSGIILDREIETATTGMTYVRFDYVKTGIALGLTAAVILLLVVGMHNASFRAM